MKKTLLLITICALTLAGFNSCKKVEALIEPENTSYQVNYRGEILDLNADPGTKGLALVALPDWRNTDESHIHLFENGVEGTNPSMSIEENNNKVAYFSATFGESQDEYEDIDIDAPIITKAGEIYKYNAIIAPGENGVYTVPAIQNPDTKVSLIDPSADFLIGCTKQIGAQYSDGTPIKLNFKRPVSIFRFAIICMDRSEKIQEVVLTTDKEITGSFKRSEVNFDEGTATFDKTEGSKSITLKYDNLAVETIFYAYFVACPTTQATIKSIVVKTDKTIYTYESSAVKNLSSTVFSSWAIDMTGKGVARGEEEGGEEGKTPQTLSFGDNEEFNHIIGASDFTEPTLTGAKTAVTYSITTVPETGVATINSTTGEVTFGSTAGTAIVTATAEENDEYEEGNASYTIYISTPSVKATYYKASAVDTDYEYIIVSNGKALANNGGAVAAEDITVESDKITLEDASDMLWKAVAETDADLLQYGKYHLSNDGKYLSRISGSTATSNLEIHAATDDAIATKMKYTMWDNDATKFWNISIYNNSPSTYYAYISSGAWVINTTNPSVDVAFFTARQPQEIVFSGNTAVYDLGTSAYTTALPTLSGAKTTVSYSSSDESVASVASNGVVTPLAKGSTVITATAAGSEDYQGDSASYTLTVTDSNDLVLTRATTIEEGATYVVVSNGKALKNNEGTAVAVDVVAATDNSSISFAKDYDLSSLVWTTAKQTTLTEGTYTFTNAGKSFYRISNSGSFSLGIAAAPSSLTKYYVWDYVDEHLTHTSVGGSSTNYYWFYYDDAWKFSYAAAIPSTNKTYLYKYVDPRAPQTLTFAQLAPSIDLASATTFKQAVSGAQTTVTYSISATPSDAATIAADGTVTATKKGTAVITATAAATKDYQGASVSYTLTINDSAAVDKYYVKVTGNEVVEGTYLVVAYSSGSKVYYAFDANASSNRQEVSQSDNKILSTEDVDKAAIEITEGPSASKFYFKTSMGYLYTTSGSAPNLDFAADIDEKYAQTVAISNGTVTIKNKANRSSEYYLTYGSSKFSYGSTSTNLELYLLEGSASGKAKRNLAFVETSVQKNVGDAAFTITLNGTKTGGVTYSSSKESVATVSTTGEVTIVAAGTTTIKAECAETTDYKADEASYTLTVVDASKTKTYTKVSSLSAGKYLISTTDSGNPICNFSDNKNTSFGENTVIVSGNSIIGPESSFDGNIVEIESSGSNWVVKYGEKYLKQAGDADPSTVSFVANKNDASVFVYSSGCLTENTYQFYHSGSGNAFMFKKNKNANNLVFYKLQEN